MAYGVREGVIIMTTASQASWGGGGGAVRDRGVASLHHKIYIVLIMFELHMSDKTLHFT